MEDQIIRADAKHRRRILLILAVCVPAGLLLLWLIQSRCNAIEALAEEDLPAAIESTLELVTIVAWIGGVGFVAISVWFWRMARAVRRAGQFPLPGAKVIKDTPIRRGRRAKWFGDALLLNAVAFFVIGTAGMWCFHSYVKTLVEIFLK